MALWGSPTVSDPFWPLAIVGRIGTYTTLEKRRDTVFDLQPIPSKPTPTEPAVSLLDVCSLPALVDAICFSEDLTKAHTEGVLP